MKIKQSISIFLLFCLLVSSCGCKKTTFYDLTYREKSFCARVEGNQFGMDFCCDIYCEDGKATKIVYSAPESLKNVTVHLLKDGSIQFERDNISATFSQNSNSFGLLLPARRLLLEGFTKSSVNTVQRISEGFYLTITLPNEPKPIHLSLVQNGFPSVLSGTDFSYRVYFNDGD